MQRIADVAHEDGDVRGPLGGLFNELGTPDATLAAALARVVAMCAEGACAVSRTELDVSIAVCDASGVDAAMYSDRVRGRASRTPGGIAALQMYTLEFSGKSVYEALNEALRSKERAKCAPYRRYIWMLMHAMREAPEFDGQAVYRGVRADLRATYKKGRTVTWHQFSSCTSTIEVLQSEQYCGTSGERTLFVVTLTQGRARWVADVSMAETEDEVLLPPNTRVRVDSTLDAGGGLVIVTLTELEPLDPILSFRMPVPGSDEEEAQRVTDEDQVRLEAALAACHAGVDDAEALFYRGLAYRDGSGVERDEAAALKLLVRAAETHVEAQVELGHMYYVGDGVAQCREEASRLYARARDGGSTDALMLGRVHFNGDGVPRDAKEAAKWYTIAAEQGSKHAQLHMGNALFYGYGVAVDKEASVGWYTKAAEQGLAEAQYFLGSAFNAGDGVLVDKAAALGWVRKAAEQGHVTAQFVLGNALYVGHGVAVDKASSVEWLRKASEQGHVEAQCSLGNALFTGDGVQVDKELGVGCVRKAAEQGHVEAQCFLGSELCDGLRVRALLFWGS